MTSERPSGGIFLSRLNIVTEIINGYDGSIPFHRYIKSFFAGRRNFGSSDRRIYAALSHGYFRLGRALRDLPFEHRMAVAVFLTQENNSPFSDYLLETYLGSDYTSRLQMSSNEKLEIIRNSFEQWNDQDLLPPGGSFSSGVTAREFIQQLFHQPLVWVRLRKNHEAEVSKELAKGGITPILSENGIPGFAAASQLTGLKSYKNGAFEIQDLASQQAGELIPVQKETSWWDCCSGAGGKSLQLLDREPSLRITASDVRESILENFRERIKRNRVRVEQILTIDLAHPLPEVIVNRTFDGILADVPCSGSGTWIRTPEQLTLFDPGEIPQLHARQLAILNRISPLVKPKGYLVYLTCSVYASENEDVVNEFVKSSPFKIQSMQVVNGISKGADCLFIAIMTRA